jgi:DNA-binding GntR family transcriptional regulator
MAKLVGELRPKGRPSHSDRIHAEYLARIQRGEIGHDDRLVDTAIAADMGVSRMPVRDALMRLTHEGYLVATTRGFMLPSLTRADVLEVFEIRRLLEPRAAAWAAQTLTSKALAEMTAAVSDAESTLESGDITLFYKASEAFRNAWLSAVPNRELQQTIRRYLSQVQAVRMTTMRDRASHEIIVAGQKALLAAFCARDGVAAADQMLRFVIAAETKFLDLSGPEPETE